MYEQAKKTIGSHTVKNIDVKDERNSKVLTEKLKKVISEEDAEGREQFSDFYTIFRAGIETSGLMMFSGIFLGLVFLLATGSIIYFKQLTEAHADRERYIVLRKLGVTKTEMKSHCEANEIYLLYSFSSWYITHFICAQRISDSYSV